MQVHFTMTPVKAVGASILLVIGFWCVGRALETAVNPDPQILGKRETMTAGLLIGVPATVGGGWLLWDQRRQRRLAYDQQLRATFFRVVKAGRGQVTPLQYAMEARIDGEAAKAYLHDRSIEYDATFQVDIEGNITYCFHLGNVDSHLLGSTLPLTFDVILEAVPTVKQQEVVKTLRDLTGLDWKTVKALVRSVPQPIQRAASQTTAEEFRHALEQVGAQVALVPSDRTQ